MLDRGYPRMPVQHASWFEVNTFNQETEPVDAELVNVSPAGACIKCEKILDPGRVITIWMDLKYTDVQVPCIAEVRWAKAVNNKFKMGLQFLK